MKKGHTQVFCKIHSHFGCNIKRLTKACNNIICILDAQYLSNNQFIVMKRNYTSLLICVFGLGAMMLVSCHHESNSRQTTFLAKIARKALIKKPTWTADQDSETFLLPSPLQIASIFKNAGLAYYANLTNPLRMALNIILLTMKP